MQLPNTLFDQAQAEKAQVHPSVLILTVWQFVTFFWEVEHKTSVVPTHLDPLF